MVHKLLWTGGFDSTFRLCELAKEKCTIQPVYIINCRRESVVFELQAQEKILNYLSKNSNVKAKILSVDYYDVKDIPFDLDVFNAFQRILKEYPTIVKQYEYLSQFAKILPHCDLCQEKFYGRTTAINRLFNDKAVLIKDKFGNIVIDKVKSDKDVYTVFGNFNFPVISLTNLEMVNLLKKWGFYDVVKLTRFCCSALDEACGVCVCCNGKFLSGVDSFQFSEMAKKRHFICTALNNIDMLNVFPFNINQKILGEAYDLYVRGKNKNLELLFKFKENLYSYILGLFKKLELMTVEELDFYFKENKTITDIIPDSFLDYKVVSVLDCKK